eukprot:1963633-Pleurochrysis_carterae.AAC.2
MGICSSAPEDPPFELSNEADGGMSPSTSIVPLTTETTSYTFGDFHVLLATQRKDIYSYNISSLDIKDGKGKIVYTITTTDSQKGTSLEFSVKDAPFFAFFKHQVLYMGILILKNAEGEKLALLKRQGTFRGLFPDRELSMPWDVYSYKQLRPGAKAHVFAEEKVYEVGGMTELLKGKEFQYTGEELSLRGRNGAKLKKYDLDSGPLKLAALVGARPGVLLSRLVPASISVIRTCFPSDSNITQDGSKQAASKHGATSAGVSATLKHALRAFFCHREAACYQPIRIASLCIASIASSSSPAQEHSRPS